MAINPDVTLRLTGAYRQNISKAEFEADGKPVPNADGSGNLNAATLSGARAALSASYIF